MPRVVKPRSRSATRGCACAPLLLGRRLPALPYAEVLVLAGIAFTTHKQA